MPISVRLVAVIQILKVVIRVSEWLSSTNYLFVYFCLCNLTMEVPRLWGIDRNPRLNCEYLWSNSSKQKAGWAPFFSKDSWC